MIRGSATLTIVVSRTTMNDPRTITTSACQWYGIWVRRSTRWWRGRAPSGWATVAMGLRLPRQRQLGGGLADVDADLDRRPERQDDAPRVHHDLDRDVLGHLGEVARGVIRRQQREGRRAGRRDRIDPTNEIT